MPDSPEVTHNAAANQFEIHPGASVALLKYAARGDTIDLIHTEVPAALEGTGLGAALARAALEYARAEELTVIPTCPFVRSYIGKHPEYAQLVATR